MRPVKLVISAFGPYASETILDMDTLGEKGIYLITGDTGAGKTTIFDAISYALYGEASGDVRTTDMFRSKYAKEDTPTFVELTFMLRDEYYKVRRNPEYMRPAKKGNDKLTRELPKAELTYPDGRVATGINVVNEAIKELIGLDKTRFSQIAMIAQGDFMQLLTADTKQRIEIFREMFKTGKYLDLQDKLKGMSIKLENTIKESGKSIIQYLADAECSCESPYNTALNNSKSDDGLGLLSDTVELIERIIEEDKENYNQIQSKISDIEAAISTTDAAIGKAENEYNTRVALEKALKAEPLSEQRYKTALKNYETEKSKTSQRENLLSVIEIKKNALEQYEELEEVSKEFDSCNKAIVSRNAGIKAQREELETWQKEQSGYNAKMESVKEASLQYERIKAKLQHIQLFKTTVQKISAETDNVIGLRKKAYNAANEYVEKRRIYDVRQQFYIDMERSYYDGQAGILASRLKDGYPCPVCGSINHPDKAVLSERVPDKEMLESVKEELENISKICSELSSSSGKAKGEAENAITALVGNWKTFWYELKAQGYSCDVETLCGKEIIQRIMEIEPDTAIEPEAEEQVITDISICAQRTENFISEKTDELSVRLMEAEKQVSLYDRLCRLIPETEKRLAQLRDNIVKNEKEIEGLNARLKFLKTRQAEIGEKLTFKSKSDALSDINRLIDEKTLMENAFVRAQEEYSRAQFEYTTLKQRIADLKNQLGNNADGDVSRLHELKFKRAELDNKRRDLQENIKELEWRINTNHRVKNAVQLKWKEMEKTEKRWIWVKSLSDTANGNIGGKDRIMFETYVQMTYFDRIIERANTRFMTMTSGQYEMKRSSQAANLRSQSGLEIDIIDHYNGSVRSVKSLSGGESFKASLALALGLSDEIQSQSGGIQIETMFVDEGFGSLDEESLQQAVAALMNLSESNRLVGIISHVGELKERIDKQIVVTKTRDNGSMAQIVI